MAKEPQELEGDLELPEEVADDVAGGAPVGPKNPSTIYSRTVKFGNVDFQGGQQTIDRTASTQPLGGLNGANE
jgi:hypothetical protein